jgi:ankyrin repeat protein
MIIRELVREFRCDPNDGISLHKACEYGNLSMIELLIECGARVNEDVNKHGETILTTAVRGNKIDRVKVLVSEYGCDTDVRGRRGRSLLHVAATKINVVRIC